MKRTILYVIVCLFSCVIFAQNKKVALIIGNNNYSGRFAPLYAPVNDAKSMDWTLQELGYQTITDTCVNNARISMMLDKFQKEAYQADVALFYYSGHGGYMGGKNRQKYYLVPSGSFQNSATLINDCYDFESVEKVMKATHAKHKLIFIDACLNSLDGSKGWVDFEPSTSADYGTAIYYATSYMTTANQGEKYSYFTQALLNHLGDTEYFNDIVWNRISNEVVDQRHDQHPSCEISKNFQDFKFNPLGYSIGSRVRDGMDSVNITVEPSNATIRIGGTTYGNNAAVYLAFGNRYDVEISADGYKTYKNSISIYPHPASQKSYHFQLSKLEPASITITSNASKAMVYIDNQQIGLVGQKLSTTSGTHILRVTQKGYYDHTTTLNLQPGLNQKFIKLSREDPSFIVPSVSYGYSSHFPLNIGFFANFSYFNIGVEYGMNFSEKMLLTQKHTNYATSTLERGKYWYLMATPGVYLRYASIDCGLGNVFAKYNYNYESVYTSSSNSEKKNYFAMKPKVTFHIPIPLDFSSRTEKLYISPHVGYMYVPKCSALNCWEVGIGVNLGSKLINN